MLSAVARGDPEDWTAWKAARRESIHGTNGWATLVGLHWLPEGRQSLGTDPHHDIVLPESRAPGTVGLLERRGLQVTFLRSPEGGSSAETLTFNVDDDEKLDPFHAGSLTFILIRRGDRVGLRVRDPAAAARAPALDWFAHQPEWRIPAQFTPYPEPRRVQVPDVTGGTQSLAVPGELLFQWQGLPKRLQVVESAGETTWWLLFRDQTTGKTTYPIGRYLRVPKPDPRGQTMLDFNFAYSPPCAFTDFATCPLPPRENYLDFPIPAGERVTATHHP